MHRFLLATVAALLLAPLASTQGGPGAGGLTGNFPNVAFPLGNPSTPAKILLGQALFFEEQLSTDNTSACATCHLPEAGGGELRPVVRSSGADLVPGNQDDTFGSAGVLAQDAGRHFVFDSEFGFGVQGTPLNSPSTVNAAFFRSLFWDLRATDDFRDEAGNVVLARNAALETQAVGPPLSEVEMGHGGITWGDVVAKLSDVKPLALATDLPTDLELFLGAETTYGPLFTEVFGSPTITRERIAMALATYERTLVSDQSPFDQGTMNAAEQRGLQVFLNRGNCLLCHGGPLFSNGQARTINLPNHPAVVKVPSLRNVGLRRRFMHSGQFSTLTQVVNHYRNIGFLQANPAERADLEAFLAGALSDPRVASASGPFERPTLRAERETPGFNVFGNPNPGTGGAPAMLAQVPATLGDEGFRLGLGGARPNAAAVLGFARQIAFPPLIVGPLEIHLSLPQTSFTSLATDADGMATWSSAIPDDPGLVGLTGYAQWFVADPGAAGGIASSAAAFFTVSSRP